jgi:hypothetical protein
VRTPHRTTVETLERLLEIAETTSREARQAVWDIRPSELANADFTRAVETAARRLIDGSTTVLSVSVIGRRRRLTREQQDVALRVVQEAVANAVRHGEAADVRLTFTYGSDAMTVSVADDGRGFVVQPTPTCLRRPLGARRDAGARPERERRVQRAQRARRRRDGAARRSLRAAAASGAPALRRRRLLAQAHDPAPPATDQLRLAGSRLRWADERRGPPWCSRPRSPSILE